MFVPERTEARPLLKPAVAQACLPGEAAKTESKEKKAENVEKKAEKSEKAAEKPAAEKK